MCALYIGAEKAWQKIKHYCSYQERNHSEVRDKLYSFGLSTPQVEESISKLIEEDYLNEERYAQSFAGGKFRMKQWGKVKIRYELKLKKVSEYCIKKALAQIDEEDYQKTFEQLALEKRTSLRSEKNIFIKKQKIRNYLLQKGYEYEMVAEYLSKM